MDMPNGDGPNFSFAGFLLLAVMGTFLWQSIPLESSRPSATINQWHPSELPNEVPARLWQDPFKAVFEYTGSLTGRKPDAKRLSNQTGETWQQDIPDCQLDILHSSIEQKQVRVMAVMLTAGSDAELSERRARRRYAVVSGLSAAGLVPQSATSIRYCYLQKEMPNDLENKYIAPYEWYVPGQSNSLIEEPYAVLLLWVNETIFASEPMSRFANLVEQVSGLRKPEQKETNTKFFVLGPASSDTLRKLAQRASEDRGETDDIDQLKQRFSGLAIDGLHILSPVATVPPPQITSDDERQTGFNKLSELFAPQKCLEERTAAKPCVSFLRTIPADDMLARFLTSELIDKRPWDSKKNYIALISEWDTLFGRSLPQAFKAVYYEKSGQRKDTAVPKVLVYSYLRGIDGRLQDARYEDPANKNKSGKNTETSSGDPFEDRYKHGVPRPAGTSQVDYMLRLAHKIRSKDAELKAEGKGRVAAIGILGSDVYDKLLILRALRPQFPYALFFTTDLDAQLLHVADFPWTRNLIVASSFGLDLNHELQGKIPPFRSNYQTSIFLSTLLATKFNHPYTADQRLIEVSTYDNFIQHTPPLLFEIGRNGAERLSPVSEQSDTVHPVTPGSSIIKNTAYVFLTILILIAAAHQIRPLSGWPVFWSVMALLFALNLVLMAILSSDGGESMSLTRGISIWPTEFIRYFALCLSIYFISRLLMELRANYARISSDKLKIKEERFAEETDNESALARPTTLADIWKNQRNWILGGAAVAILVLAGSLMAMRFVNEYLSMSKTFIIFNIFSIAVIVVLLIAILVKYALFSFKRVPWVLGCIPAVVIVAAGMPLTRSFGAEYFWFPPAYWFFALSLWFYLIFKRYPTADRVDSINDWMKKMLRKDQSGGIGAKEYWLTYCQLGQAKGRWYRAMSLWLLFIAFGALVFSITGFPVTPCRGTFSCVLDKALVIASVSSMLLLIFLVLDEFRLTIYWIKGLNQFKNINWAGTAANEHAKLGRRLQCVAHESFKIELIAERTEEIGRLIYYPFLIIILMLVSRSSYFDNWGLPHGIAIVVAINILLLVSAGVKLRYEAEKCRGEVIEKLNAKLIETKGYSASSAKTDIAQIQHLLDDVKGIHIGAFQRFTEQPLLRASLLLFGAMSIAAAEYLSIFS